jgi:hypothetical protein
MAGTRNFLLLEKEVTDKQGNETLMIHVVMKNARHISINSLA